MLHVNENDTLAEKRELILYSNLPITCQSENRGHCRMRFKVLPDTKDIAMRVRYMVTHNTSSTAEKSCTYILYERDWKSNEGFAYNEETRLQLIAKV